MMNYGIILGVLGLLIGWRLAKGRSIILNVIVLSILVFCASVVIWHLETSVSEQLASGVDSKAVWRYFDFTTINSYELIEKSTKDFWVYAGENFTENEGLATGAILFLISLLFALRNKFARERILSLKRRLKNALEDAGELEGSLTISKFKIEKLQTKKDELQKVVDGVRGSLSFKVPSVNDVKPLDESALNSLRDSIIPQITEGVLKGVESSVGNLVGRVEKSADGLGKSVETIQRVANQSKEVVGSVSENMQSIKRVAGEMSSIVSDVRGAATKAETVANCANQTASSLVNSVGEIENVLKTVTDSVQKSEGAASSAKESSDKTTCLVESLEGVVEKVQESGENLREGSQEMVESAKETLAEAKGKQEGAQIIQNEINQTLNQILNLKSNSEE